MPQQVRDLKQRLEQECRKFSLIGDFPSLLSSNVLACPQPSGRRQLASVCGELDVYAGKLNYLTGLSTSKRFLTNSFFLKRENSIEILLRTSPSSTILIIASKLSSIPEVSDKEVVKVFQVALEDVYKDATPKATQAMIFCLSDLTRKPNKLKTPYFMSKSTII